MRYNNLINILFFYLCWWLSIYGAINEMYFLGIISVSIYMIFHFSYLSKSYYEYYYIIICFLISFVPDTVLLNLNLISYNGILSTKYNLLPLWALSLWLCFSLSIFHSFSFLKKKYFISSVLGIVSGPVIYYSCSMAEIIAFKANINFILILIAVIWSFLLPLYVFIADILRDKCEN